MNLFLLLALTTQVGEVRVNIEANEGEALCSVHAEQATPQVIFGALMREARALPSIDSMPVVGADFVPTEPLLDVVITDRPFSEALDIVMGCVGLRSEHRAGTLTITKEFKEAASGEELLESARRSLVNTFTAHPNTDLSARILHTLARVEEKLGAADAASGHLRQIAEDFPNSDLVPAALSHAGHLLQEAGNWGEAKQVLGQLCNLPYAHDLYPNGLLELARCHAQLGEGHEGLRVLDALDAIWPLEKLDETLVERAERLFVRAACLHEAGDPGQTLVLLDQCNGLGHRGDLDPQVFPLRARALEAVGRPVDAALAWLARSRSAESQALQGEALTEAARLALVADDQLVLDLIYKHGEEIGVEDSLEGLLFEAHARLGISTGEMEPNTPVGFILLGRMHLDSGEPEQALAPLLEARAHREELAQADLLDMNILLGRAAHEAHGVDSAVAEMREGLSMLSRRGDRTQIYLLAAELYEGVGRYDDAIAAYQGQL